MKTSIAHRPAISSNGSRSRFTGRERVHVLACGLALVLASCSGGDDKAGNAGAGTDAPSSALDPSLVLTSPPASTTLSVVEARSAAQPGEAVVLRGKVGGRMDPFVEGRALLVLADEKAIASCDMNPEDACTTPWDYCCEAPEAIKASTATIQVLTPEGGIAKSGLKGLAGIKELSVLVVKGTVDVASDADHLVVNADGIYVEKP